MKKRTLAAAGLAMIMAVSLAGCSTTVSVPDTVKVENVGDSSDGKITMDSSETVKIVPDMAKIVFAVTSEATKADECQQKNTESLNSLTGYLKGQGIDEKSISTSGYYLRSARCSPTVSETGRMRSIPCLTIPADMMTRMRRH